MTCLKNISCIREHFRRSCGVASAVCKNVWKQPLARRVCIEGYGGGIEGCSAANTGQNSMRAEYVIRGIFGALVRREEGYVGLRGQAVGGGAECGVQGRSRTPTGVKGWRG